MIATTSIPEVHGMPRRSSTTEPLTARSVVLSTLLGYHPPELPVSTLVRVGTLFDVAERTTRVALSRMVADGDVTTRDGVYRLTDRLRARQQRQDASAEPAVTGWDGAWTVAVVTAGARAATERNALRQGMAAGRLAELREGVWVRPDNLDEPLDDVVARQCTVFRASYPEPRDLVGALWDLDTWAATAREMLAELAATADLRTGFVLVADVVHHLRADPHLPAELLPDDWPGDELRERYRAYRTDFARRLRAEGP
jgi:phenylacetic acid degradation operon negative regulatory protein